MATATATNKTSIIPNNPNYNPDVVRDTFNITTIAAAGTTQADATAIGNNQPFVLISNNTAANGVVLPTAFYIGQKITIFPQLVTDAPKVYPPVGGKINNGTANASVASTARKAVEYIAVETVASTGFTGLNWVTVGL